jgi:hypothetical protein
MAACAGPLSLPLDPRTNLHNVPDRFDVIYHSFGTMTAFGADKITPVSSQARSFSIHEAILDLLARRSAQTAPMPDDAPVITATPLFDAFDIAVLLCLHGQVSSAPRSMYYETVRFHLCYAKVMSREQSVALVAGMAPQPVHQ